MNATGSQVTSRVPAAHCVPVPLRVEHAHAGLPVQQVDEASAFQAPKNEPAHLGNVQVEASGGPVANRVPAARCAPVPLRIEHVLAGQHVQQADEVLHEDVAIGQQAAPVTGDCVHGAIRDLVELALKEEGRPRGRHPRGHC